ncbi:MAG: DUF362 domain-containing protein [Desulfovibrionaceae bacterium]|nr:DUF362 domain-containing protein [Desulfovibrionaceae bacterium]
MNRSRRTFLTAGVLAAGALTGAALGSTLPFGSAPEAAQAAASEVHPLFPAHAPLGEGQGVHPGRVVWTHRPQAVSWDGTGFWWQPEHFAEDVILEMVRSGIAALAGTATAAEGWAALFAWHNAKSGRTGGRKPGEKIAIKCNMNGAAAYDDDRDGRTHESFTSPVLLKCLLTSLVEDAGVAPSDITAYDAGRIFPDFMMAMCREGILSGVNFRHRDPGGELDAVPDEGEALSWSGEVRGAVCRLPRCVTEARYLINLASLKGHCYGMTLCGKNHFGSILNTSRMRAPQAAGLHGPVSSGRMGVRAVLTDLMAHRHLGGKTMLCLLDGLITAPGESVNITRRNAVWREAPFNGAFCASLFFSQDMVAIDSVGADFLTSEPVMLANNSELSSNRGMENYLHEAALAHNPPSGAPYGTGDGPVRKSLGVHEHWNNARDKLYSRNLGRSEGIELVRA